MGTENSGLMSSEEAKKASLHEVLRRLSTNETGLSTIEAEKRLQKYGFNEIVEKKTNPIVRFLSYFWGPIPWMIEAAVIVSLIPPQHWEDFGIIFALLLVNAAVGFWQENKAENAIALLKRRLALKARVFRGGKWLEIAARNLVPGDVIRVRLGDIIPADIKLMSGNYLLTDESALTGESLPVEKHVSDVAYSGSVAKQGEMDALVIATGVDSYFGKTARLVEEAKTVSHFQKAVVKIGDYLIILAIVLVSIVFLASLLRHESIPETLTFALVLIVAAIPAALPAVLTVTMAVGAVALAKKESIVSKLVSIEELAGMDVLCSDKTGTLTKNELTVAELAPFENFTDGDLLLMASLASREEDMDPIDNAVIAKAKTSKETGEAITKYAVTDFKPFDPVSKRTEATVEDARSNRWKVAKGAPQVILSLVANKDEIGKTVNQKVSDFAEKGFRALGVAKTDAHGKWQFAGILALHDSPREDSAETIEAAESMGVNVKMVTGDHIAIAKEIARELKLGNKIMPAFAFIGKSGGEAASVVEEADGFAEVFPEHKYNIVETLQSKGHIVGMTGDGVNDAPALKKANAGIAVAGATDAAKSAADIVFTKPGLAVIVDAIRESRRIFERMNSYATYRIAETIRVLIFLMLSILLFSLYPITPVMIVLLAMLNDIPIMMIAYDNTKISQGPARWHMRRVLSVATLLGVAGVVASFLLLLIGQNILQLDLLTLRTLVFLKLAVAGHMTIYLTRTGEKYFWNRPLPAPALFVATETTQLLGTLFAVYGIFMQSIGWGLAAFVWVYALAFFIINNFVKVYFYKLMEAR